LNVTNILGILIFALSYFIFLRYNTFNLSKGEHILCGLFLLSCSIFLGIFISFLFRELVKKVKSTLNERLLNNPDAARIFKKIETDGNKIENSPHYQYGLAGCIDIEAVAHELNINESIVRNFIQEFNSLGWLIYDNLGDIHGVSDYGRKVMRRKKLIK
jgi:hypothetical protein